MFIMMKRSTKRFLIAGAVLLVAGIVIWGMKFRFQVPEVKGETLLRYVPAQAPGGKDLTCVIGINRFSRLYGSLKNTNFFTALNSSGLYDEIFSMIAGSGIWDGGQAKIDITEKKALDIIGSRFTVSVYGGSLDELEVLAVSSLGNGPGTAELEKHVKPAGDGVALLGKKYFTVSDGLLFVSTDRKLLLESLALKAQKDNSVNFNSKFPWVEDLMDNGEIFMFSVNNSLSNIISQIFRDTGIVQRMGSPAHRYTFQEFKLDRGLMVNTYNRLEDQGKARLPEDASESLRFIPKHALLAGVVNNFDIKQWFERIFTSRGTDVIRYKNIDFEKDIMPYLGKEFGYALLGPQQDTPGLILPALFLYGEVIDRGSEKAVIENIRRMSDGKVKEAMYGGSIYYYTHIPIFMGQGVEICVVPVKVRGKRYVSLTSSKKVAELIIDLSKGRAESLESSPAWREISHFLPEKSAGFAYADISPLVRSVGLFVAGFRNQPELEKLIRQDPFAWAGPSGSADIYRENYLLVKSYMPMQDLGKDRWQTIFDALIPLVKKSK